MKNVDFCILLAQIGKEIVALQANHSNLVFRVIHRWLVDNKLFNRIITVTLANKAATTIDKADKGRMEMDLGLVSLWTNVEILKMENVNFLINKQINKHAKLLKPNNIKEVLDKAPQIQAQKKIAIILVPATATCCTASLITKF
jgi:hypothetical protein